ncbi:hypothetical protein EQV77_06300 [Halobacillus fulvus]|nr:hypothetical protein EQV77_06300 [Halobacillus fulvus]
MSNKLKILSIIGIVLIGIGIFWISSLNSTEDEEYIEEIVRSLQQSQSDIAHIEFLDDHQAIAFYEWQNEGEDHFGKATLKKEILGWEIIGGGTAQVDADEQFGRGFIDLRKAFTSYTDLLSGKISNPAIERVTVALENGKEYEAEVVEYQGQEKLWFYLTKGEDLSGAKVTALTSEGEEIALTQD